MTTHDRMTARLQLGAATVFVLLIANLPAYAAATIVQGYYEDSASKTCTTQTQCTAIFSAVPTGKLVTIRYLSCRISTASNSPSLTSLRLGSNGRSTYLVPSLVSTSSTGARTWHSKDELLRLAEDGSTPSVTVQFAAAINSTIACTLTGQITP